MHNHIRVHVHVPYIVLMFELTEMTYTVRTQNACTRTGHACTRTQYVRTQHICDVRLYTVRSKLRRASFAGQMPRS